MVALKPVASVTIILLIFNVNYITAEYDVAKYCQLVPPSTKLPSLENCQIYYTCLDSNTPKESKCFGTDVFDKDEQACVPKEQSDCLYGINSPCEGLNGTFTKDPKECRLWHYCLDGKSVNSGFCNKGQYFDGEMCVSGTCTYENVNVDDGKVTEVKYICNIMQNNQFFGDFDDCRSWQKCVKSNEKPKDGKCLHDLVYDVKSRMCLDYKVELCTRTVGAVKPSLNKPTGTCINGHHRPDEKICSIYYFCKDSAWEKLECEKNNYFDAKTETCVDRQKATPVNTCDRCQYSAAQWVNAVDSNCTKYLTCKDGHKVGDVEGSCGDGNYFNEKSQICLIGNANLPSYRNESGACFCDWACKLKNCGADDACKNDINCDTEHGSNQIKCNIAKCAENDINCKNTACGQYSDEREKIICKLDVCKDNDECKQQVCTAARNRKDFCEIQKCKNDKCKTSYCDSKSDPLEKANCQVLLCPDEDCKMKTCDKIADETQKSKCKVNVCDGRSTEDDKVKCKLSYCSGDDCENSCKIYTDLKKRVKCKQDLCKGDERNNCLIEACNDYGSFVRNRVQCKLNTCEDKDKQCKENICSQHTQDDRGEKIECEIAICDKEQCGENYCDKYPQTDESYFFCKIAMCKDTKCKQDICANFYSGSEKEHEKLSCQLKYCEKAQSCITEFCSKHPDFRSCKQ
ncbi:peritrophin-48-like [Cochliomyia hominivorax]